MIYSKKKFRTIATLLFIGCTIQLQAQTQEPFVTTWSDGTIELVIFGGAYDVDVNYDGDFDDTVDMINKTGTITIDFGSTGRNHTIAVRSNPTNNTNNQLRINHKATGSTPQKLISIDKWGDIVWTSMANAFRFCSNMTLADDAGVPDLTMVTDMSGAFYRATSFNSDLNNWDVSNVTNMSDAFYNAERFNGDISNWNVSKCYLYGEYV